MTPKGVESGQPDVYSNVVDLYVHYLRRLSSFSRLISASVRTCVRPAAPAAIVSTSLLKVPAWPMTRVRPRSSARVSASSSSAKNRSNSLSET